MERPNGSRGWYRQCHMTREDKRRHGYASIALNAAVQTFKDEGATDIGLLFCAPDQRAGFFSARLDTFLRASLYRLPNPRVRFEGALAPHVHDFRRASNN